MESKPEDSPNETSLTKEDKKEKIVTTYSTENIKKTRGRPRKDLTDSVKNDVLKNGNDKTENEDDSKKEKSEPDISKENDNKKQQSKPPSYDQYDFLEEEDDEVMPAPKKRKSQDSVNVSEDSNSKKTEKASDEPAIEELSTTERAILDEKAKVESEEK